MTNHSPASNKMSQLELSRKKHATVVKRGKVRIWQVMIGLFLFLIGQEYSMFDVIGRPKLRKYLEPIPELCKREKKYHTYV